MNGRLIPVSGGDPIPLLKAKVLIGRRSDCDICLGFPNVSGHHCELRFIDGLWLVKDLRSSNGVKINGVKVEKKRLMPGDTIAIARQHLFRIEYDPPKNVKLDKAELEGAGAGAGSRGDSDIFSRSLLDKAGLAKAKDDDFDSSLWKEGDAPTGDTDPPRRRWDIERE